MWHGCLLMFFVHLQAPVEPLAAGRWEPGSDFEGDDRVPERRVPTPPLLAAAEPFARARVAPARGAARGVGATAGFESGLARAGEERARWSDQAGASGEAHDRLGLVLLLCLFCSVVNALCLLCSLDVLCSGMRPALGMLWSLVLSVKASQASQVNLCKAEVSLRWSSTSVRCRGLQLHRNWLGCWESGFCG